MRCNAAFASWSAWANSSRTSPALKYFARSACIARSAARRASTPRSEADRPGGQIAQRLLECEVAREQVFRLGRGTRSQSRFEIAFDLRADFADRAFADGRQVVVEQPDQRRVQDQLVVGGRDRVAVGRGAGERRDLDRRGRRGRGRRGTSLHGRRRRRQHEHAGDEQHDRDQQAFAARPQRAWRSPPRQSPAFLRRLAWLRNRVLGSISNRLTMPAVWFTSSR